MRVAWLTFAGVLANFLLPAAVPAQALTVQQPALQQFGVDTAVSVPDRGSLLLGGMSSAASSRSVNGPFRSGSSRGISHSSSTVTAHVYIHDFAAMDAALLDEAPDLADVPVDETALTPADHALRYLSRQNRTSAGELTQNANFSAGEDSVPLDTVPLYTATAPRTPLRLGSNDAGSLARRPVVIRRQTLRPPAH